MLADKLIDLAQFYGQADAREHLLPHFATFLKDTESEVRTAALNKLPEFIKFLDSQQILQKIVPALADL